MRVQPLTAGFVLVLAIGLIPSWFILLHLVSALGAVVAFFGGAVIAPPTVGSGVVAEVSSQVFRYVSVVLAFAIVLGEVRGRRPSTDRRAQAFFDRTASVSEERASAEVPPSRRET